MNSTSDSSPPRHPPPPQSEIEVIGGAFHPDRIEIQDFTAYPLTLDLRSWDEFARDHVPGAVHLPMERAFATDRYTLRDSALPEPLSPEVEELLMRVPRGHYVLVYDARADRDAMQLARSLERRGAFVDVLPGGWAAYRQWVDAGLEVLPRLVSWRVLASPVACETSAVLERMVRIGHQVLDLQRLAGDWFGSPLAPGRQPHQEALDTAIVDTLREFDGRRPVWTNFVPAQLGSLRLRLAVSDAVAVGSLYRLEVPLAERLRHWRWRDPAGVVAAERLGRRRGLAGAPQGAGGDALLAATLHEVLEPELEARIASAGVARRELPTLVIESFEPARLTAAIRRWLRPR